MPSRTPTLTDADVLAFSRERCFSREAGDLVGAEVEWLVAPLGDPGSHARWPVVRDALAGVTPPAGSRISFEPGGQIEISSLPFDDARRVCDAVARDLTAVQAALAAAGHETLGLGLDPLRAERRVLDLPRYVAMEAFFDMDNLAGRTMMTRTAAVQVNVGLGEGPGARWRRAHAIGPVLAAAFANSPFFCGAANGWKSNRLATWAAIDRTRTAPADGLDADHERAWAAYVSRARVMLVRDGDAAEPVLEPLPFTAWMESGRRGQYPDMGDLEYHCTTLFPPVRPRGWLELRVCDALPDPWWRVPVEVADAVMRDDDAGARAEAACADARGMWTQAARSGLSDPVLAAAARALFAIAGGSDVTREFRTRFVDRGRCPADDLLDAGAPMDALSEGRVPAWT